MEHLVYKVYSQEIHNSAYRDKVICNQFETIDSAISFVESSCANNVEGYYKYVIIRNSLTHYEYRLGEDRDNGASYFIEEYILTNQERLKNAAHRTVIQIDAIDDGKKHTVLGKNENLEDFYRTRLETICEIIRE